MNYYTFNNPIEESLLLNSSTDSKDMHCDGVDLDSNRQSPGNERNPTLVNARNKDTRDRLVRDDCDAELLKAIVENDSPSPDFFGTELSDCKRAPTNRYQALSLC